MLCAALNPKCAKNELKNRVAVVPFKSERERARAHERERASERARERERERESEKARTYTYEPHVMEDEGKGRRVGRRKQPPQKHNTVPSPGLMINGR